VANADSTMDLAQELIAIWNALMEQEIKLIELRRTVLAGIDILRSQPHLFDSYQTTVRDLAGSAIILNIQQSLQDMEHKIHRLAAEKSAQAVDES